MPHTSRRQSPRAHARQRPLGSPGVRVQNAKVDFVEVAGIEPASFSTSPGLLRAQSAARFSAPAVTQTSRRAGSVAVRCPDYSRDRTKPLLLLADARHRVG